MIDFEPHSGIVAPVAMWGTLFKQGHTREGRNILILSRIIREICHRFSVRQLQQFKTSKWHENQSFCAQCVSQSTSLKWSVVATCVHESADICEISTFVVFASERMQMRGIYQVLRNHHGRRYSRRFHHPVEERWNGREEKSITTILKAKACNC